jgi:NYN domain
VDRCALFVDAGYVLADGAMAVHGTRQRDSVSWDYAGLVKLLTGLSRDRTGLPVLRCYWYETVEGRRNAEHETLANLPGLKLRLGRIRPGRREGVETEMHRDLATLARNRAISDAVIVSAETDLAEIITEVQDLGMRIVIVHVPVDGNWTISGPLREECDDIVEVSGAHLRPFVDLIVGAEPAERGEQYSNGSYPTRGFETRTYQRRGLHNGHGAGIGAVTHQGLPAAALPAPPTIYTAPVVEEYQAAAQPSGPIPPGSGAMGPGAASTGPPAVPPQPAGPAAPAAAAPQASAPTAPAVSPPSAGPSSAADSPPQSAPPHHAGPAQQADPPAQMTPVVQAAPAAQAGPAHQADVSAQLGSGAQFGSVQADSVQLNSAQFGSGQFGSGQFGSGQLGSRHAGPVQADTGHQGGFAPQAEPSAQVVPSVQVGPAHQAGPAHHADHGALAGEPAAPHGSHALAADLSGERQMPDVARNEVRPQEAAGSGRPGSHASQPMSAGPLPSPVPQSSGPVDAPLRPSQPEYRPPSPDQLGPRSGLPIRELPAREGPGLREAMSREAMAAPGPEAGRPGLASARFADVSVPAPPTSPHAVSAPPTAQHSVPPSPMSARQMPGQQYPSTPPGHFGGGPGPMPPHQQFPGPGPGQPPSVMGSGYSSPQPGQGPYGGPQSPAHSQVSQPVPQPMTLSLADAVQAAHAEGFGFGDAVARDAPALWLEAVLARKPRMPSDLEARLLQGSALPIDSLLHDEVRHSLRRGFWDALERSRR